MTLACVALDAPLRWRADDEPVGVLGRWFAMVVESLASRTYADPRQPGQPRTESVISPPSRDFDEFFLDHYDDMTRSLSAAYGDADRAAEAVQDAFMRAYGRWRTVRRMDSPAAWVRRVAINRLRDLYRKAERQARAERRAAEEPGSGAPVSASSDIVDMLSVLPERQRTAMALFYVADLPVREIARSMNISEGAVKAHLSQGRAAVASRLAPTPRSTGDA